MIPFQSNPRWNNTNIHHGFFGRLGGISTAPFDSLNVGLSTNDNRDHVLANRQLISRQLGLKKLWLTQQVHGTDVFEPRHHHEDAKPEADIIFNPPKDTGLAIQTADCLPVFFVHQHSSVIAGAHAGWRGLVKGVIGVTVERFLREGILASEIEVAVGPCIGPGAFEVGEEVVDAIPPEYRQFCSFKHFKTQNWHVDLRLMARLMLEDCDIREIWISGQCTYTEKNNYFSHRYATHHYKGRTGRQLAVIGWTS